MISNYRRYRSPMINSSFGSHRSLINRLSQPEHEATIPSDGDIGAKGDSICHFVGSMNIDVSTMQQPFSTDTSFTRPIRLGYYSISYDLGRNLEFSQDASALKYLHYPDKVNFDLLNRFYGNPPSGGNRASGGCRGRGPKTMHFLEWIAANRNDLMSDSDINEENVDPTKDNFADFICDSFVLKSIMSTPYISAEDAWVLVAVKLRGIIYVVEVTRGNNFTVSHPAASSHAGLAFRELLTKRYDGKISPYNAKGNRDSFWIVCKSNVASHRVLYNARIECALDYLQLKKTIDQASLIDIRIRPTGVKGMRWERQALFWWITATLRGVEQIFCGERDEKYSVHQISQLSVEKLPNSRFKWSPKACVDFLDKTLTFIKSNVTDELVVYRLTSVQDEIICSRLSEPVEKYFSSSYFEQPMSENCDAPISKKEDEELDTINDQKLSNDQEMGIQTETNPSENSN